MGTVITTYVDDEVAVAIKMLAHNSGISISSITRYLLRLNIDQIREIGVEMFKHPEGSIERLSFKEAIRRVKIQNNNKKFMERSQNDNSPR